MDKGTIYLKNETLVPLPSYIVTRGFPFPAGAIKNAADITVTDGAGKKLPVFAKALQTRKDGSIEWALLDIVVDLGGQEKKAIYVAPGASHVAAVKNPVVISEAGDDFTISNGISSVTISRKPGPVIRKMVINGKLICDESHNADLQVLDTGGKVYRASLSGQYKVVVQHQNPARATIRLEGKHKARDGSTLMDFALRFELTADSPDVKLEHTFYCREHVDGKVFIKGMKLVMPTTMDPSASKLLRQAHQGQDWMHKDHEMHENIEVVASAVGDIDTYAATAKGGPGSIHPCAGGSVFLRNAESFREDWSKYAFHMRPGQASGFRADLQISGVRSVQPMIGWKQKDFTLVTTFEHFRQLHPKSISIDESLITWSIWPEWSTPMMVVKGVSKSHIIFISGENKPLSMIEVMAKGFRWEYLYVEPVDISFDPAWFAHAAVLDCQHMLKYQPSKYPLIENLIEPVPAAGNPNRHTYDRQPATGMFHFGCQVNPEATSCTNNEDDILVYFPLQHFLRTGHTYAWDYGKEAARHYMEVDFCEWSTDMRQKGGLIPHTGQHFVGNVYSSHQWAEGILAYYYLTGDERAKNVVLSVAENHIYWIYNLTYLVCCDGREAGVPLINLAAAYHLNRDEKYIAAAKHICKNFFEKFTNAQGKFEYPYPQGTDGAAYKTITGYGDWSSFAGLFRMWEETGEEYFRALAVKLLDQAIQPGGFSLNDVRGMDFYAAWAFGVMTGDMDGVFKRVEAAVPMLLRRGGHPMRRIHFLKEMDERGLIDEKMVGNRAGAI
jgi:hypothetical protein